MKISWETVISIVVAGIILILLERFAVNPLADKIANTLELE